jgi:hypothetical protein
LRLSDAGRRIRGAVSALLMLFADQLQFQFCDGDEQLRPDGGPRGRRRRKNLRILDASC